jgi:nanoRNase/pAp phosphatase (c-di-AMP/oligoRNAs hydrolase)
LSETSLIPLASIDHHTITRNSDSAAFRDVRPEVAATATIAASYLREQLLVPNESMATSLVYAMRTETKGGETFHTNLDRAILTWLTGLANPTTLAEIESAPFSCSHLSELSLALQSTLLLNGTAFCYLPEHYEAGLVAEVADWLIRCEELYCVFCAATCGRDVLVSVRTKRATEHAGSLAQSLVQGLGKAGGHQHRGGATIRDPAKQGMDSLSLRCELLGRWRQLCGIKRRRTRRLVRCSKGRMLVAACHPASTGVSE